MSDEVGFVIIKGHYYCSWCEAAADFIEERGFTHVTRVVGRDKLMEEGSRARMCTVPIIYHGVHLVGGHKELIAYLNEIRVDIPTG